MVELRCMLIHQYLIQPIYKELPRATQTGFCIQFINTMSPNLSLSTRADMLRVIQSFSIGHVELFEDVFAITVSLFIRIMTSGQWLFRM